MAYKSDRCQSYVEPQDVELKVDYCLTINPLKHFTNPLEFKRQIGQYLQDNLMNPYEFYVERSAKGKYHIHGIIAFQSLDSVNQFYDFLQKMDEEKIMSYKFGEQFEETKDVEVIPGEDVKVPMSWKEYCSKQEKYWEAQEFKPKFTHKYNPGITCVFNPKPKKSRSTNPKRKKTNKEIMEEIEQIQQDKDVSII